MHVWPFYGALAVASCLMAWREPQMRQVGVALVVSWALSNLATGFFAPTERPAAYTVCEAFVMSMAFLAFVCGASRWLVVVVAVSVVSVGLNLYLSVLTAPTRAQVIAWQWSTNMCFLVECLVVLGTGVYARTHPRVVDWDGPAALHGRPSASSTTP